MKEKKKKKVAEGVWTKCQEGSEKQSFGRVENAGNKMVDIWDEFGKKDNARTHARQRRWPRN